MKLSVFKNRLGFFVAKVLIHVMVSSVKQLNSKVFHYWIEEGGKLSSQT